MGELLSVVVPVYGNSTTVAELAARVDAAMVAEGADYELVFVDDDCPRGSGPVLDALAMGSPHVRVVHLATNVGQHRAILTGLAAARGDWCAVMDADLQDPPEALRRLWIERHRASVIFAGRRGRYQVWHRMVTSRLFKGVQSVVAGVPTDAGVFFLASRATVEDALDQPTSTISIVPLMGLAATEIVSVPVTRAERPSGVSAYGSWMRLRSGVRSLRCALEIRTGTGRGLARAQCGSAGRR